ncbi:hypothetical protein Ait01nite_093880 [Actinoplanes italicus]|uniref:Uncharacterized protein n=1 Tax=Actinoplanes italicus TaxID=113567 RepID=A0A2T0JPA5_9ACTN|nr:hypothetical protein [Actinoplanes italicus]PRX09465.1 hypothetical protein CLV67_13641 [Actinoplanes italicus]GIE36343.1 hypothetical protein Ait01nite_093880 [Actinoplanes italicus]
MPGSLGHVITSVLDERVRELIDVARPYWQRLSDAVSWSEETNRRLDEHDLGRGRYLPAPAEPARAMAGLLATRWDPGRLDHVLATVRVPNHREDLAHLVVRILSENSLPPAELESWIRWVFRGGLFEVERSFSFWWLPHFRVLLPPETAARTVASFAGITSPAEQYGYHHSTGRGARDFAWAHDHIPDGLPHLTERLGGPLGRVPLRPQWEGASVATLLAEGWTAERIRREVPPGPPSLRDRVLGSLSALVFIPLPGLDAWRDALTPAEMPPHERLTAMTACTRLRTLVRLWQSTGLPDDVAPWYAAAGLSPEEAIDRHQNGTSLPRPDDRARS